MRVRRRATANRVRVAGDGADVPAAGDRLAIVLRLAAPGDADRHPAGGRGLFSGTPPAAVLKPAERRQAKMARNDKREGNTSPPTAQRDRTVSVHGPCGADDRLPLALRRSHALRKEVS